MSTEDTVLHRDDAVPSDEDWVFAEEKPVSTASTDGDEKPVPDTDQSPIATDENKCNVVNRVAVDSITANTPAIADEDKSKTDNVAIPVIADGDKSKTDKYGGPAMTGPDKSDKVNDESKVTDPSESDSNVTIPLVKDENAPDPSVADLVVEDLWSQNAKVVETATRKLSGLAIGTNPTATDNTDRMLRLGAHLVLFKNLEKYKQNEQIVATTLRLLLDISRTVKFDKYIGTLPGVLDKIIGPMETFPDSSVVHWNACGLIGYLFRYRFSDSAGVLPVVVQSMTTFPEDAAVQRFGCWALQAFITSNKDKKKMRKEFYKAGALSTLSASMEHHPENVYICECLSFCIKQLLE